MVEYRQRLRVMLSASQAKYELERSSGIIANEINYIYYFTYFHKFDIHPFWDEFEKEFNLDIEEMIKGKVGALRSYICCLWSSYSSLNSSVTTVHDNISQLITSINEVENRVNVSIEALEKHIKEQVETNKNKIKQTIKDIETKITYVDSILKHYIDVGPYEIKYLQHKISYSILKILDTINAIRCYFRRIMCLLALSRKIIYTFKVGERTISNTIKDDSGDSYGIYFQSIESSETTQEALELEKIVQKLGRFCESIKELKKLETPLSLTSSESLKPENLCTYLQEIKQIETQLSCLEEKVAQLKTQKGLIERLINRLADEGINYKGYGALSANSEGFSTQRECPQTSQNFKAYAIYTLTFTKTIVYCNKEIQNLLPKVGEEITKLDKDIKAYREHLQAITQQLEELKTMIKLSKGLNVIGGFNQKLQSYITKSEKDGKSDLYELIKKLVSAETRVEQISNIINKICPVYFVYVYLMKIVVRILLAFTEEKYPIGAKLFNLYLQLARSALYFIMCKLTELLRLRENILNLYHPILALKHLKDFQKEILGLNVHRERLKRDEETLNPYLKTLDSIGCRIGEINSAKEELAKLSELSQLQDMPKNLQTISYHYTSIERLNSDLGGLGDEKFLESLLKVEGVGGAGGGSLSSVLEEIEKKLSGAVDSNLHKIIERFKEKVQSILNECSKRLKTIEVPILDQNTFPLSISTCITHANGLIFISNFRTCKELDNLDNLLPELTKSLKSLESCIKCVTSICQKIKDCECVTAAVSKIESGCKTGDEILNSLKECIQELEKKKIELESKKQEISGFKEKIDSTVKEAEALLVKIYRYRKIIEFRVDCLQLHFSKVTTELVPFLDKVNGVICTLEKEIDYLKQQLDTTREEVTILLGFKSGVNEEIEKMKLNIEAITQAGEKIKEEYQKYTKSFKDFNKALKDLETCINYRIAQFLRCSLCTTTCNLKRQIRNTKWDCPDSDCNSCLRHSLLGDTVTKVEQQLYGYSWLVFGHFSTLESKVFISKLYRCILRADDIVGIVQVVDCCCCVKKLQGNDSVNAENSNQPKTCMMKYKEYLEYVKNNKETQDNPHTQGTLDTPIDTDNNLYHLCLCLAIRYRLYPCILKTVTLLVHLELGGSGNIARKFGTQSLYNTYYKQSRCNSHNLSLSMMLVLCTWVIMHLATSLQYRYKIEHDKVNCCTKDKAKCDCNCNKSGGSSGSSSDNCCSCCVCKDNNGSASTTPTATNASTTPTSNTTCSASSSGPTGTASTTPTGTPAHTPKPCCCKKTEGNKGCEKTECNKENSQSCCCKCCCQCVCEKKRKCDCKCKPEEHCFCTKYRDDCYYRWFIYVILYICHLVDHAFSLTYWDIQHAMQCLSNLLSKLDAVCWEADRRCVTVAVKTPGEPGTTGKPEQTQAKQTNPVVVEEVITHSREHSSVSSPKVPGPPNVSVNLERTASRTSAVSLSSPIDPKPIPKHPSLNGKKPSCRCDSICKLCQNFQVLQRVIAMARQTFYWVSKPIKFTGFGIVMSGKNSAKPKGKSQVLMYYMAYYGPIINKITVTWYRIVDHLQRLSLNECQSLYFLQFISQLSFFLMTHETFNPLTGYQIRYVLERESKRYTSLLQVKKTGKAGEKRENDCTLKKCSICKKHEITIQLLTGLQKVLNSFIKGTNVASGSGLKAGNAPIIDQQTKELGKRCGCGGCCLICLQSGDIILFITDLVVAIQSYSKETKATSTSVPKDTLMSITQTFSITKVKAVQKNTSCQCTLVFAYFKYLLDVLHTRQIPTYVPQPVGESKAEPTTAQGTNGTNTSKTVTKTVITEIKGDPVIYVGLKKMMEQFFGQEYFKCGCESVIQCCCCCKCEECGNVKERKCNEKGCGHANGDTASHSQDNGSHDTTQATQPGQGDQAAATGHVKCPCQDGKNGKDCCCQTRATGTDGQKTCNCTDGKTAPAKEGCECCCLSCCADKENEDKKKEGQKKEGEKKENKKDEKNCPCKKKKKKDKPKVHCKNNKKYKDKRCCCKCCPETNGGENGSNSGGNNGGTTTSAPNGSSATNTKDDKECCCCCKCKSTCKGGTSGAPAGTSGCKCPNGMVQSVQPNGKKDCNCMCYCCFECEHKKSALKSICKQLARELNSSILVLSKVALRLVVTTSVFVSKIRRLSQSEVVSVCISK